MTQKTKRYEVKLIEATTYSLVYDAESEQRAREIAMEDFVVSAGAHARFFRRLASSIEALAAQEYKPQPEGA